MIESSIDNFSEIAGHKELITQLKQVSENQKAPHSYIFSGPKSVGKKLVALKFASELLGLKEGSVKKLSQSPDFHFLAREEGKKDISVEQIRTLCNNLRLKPFSNSKSIAVVDEAHLMSTSAANALLMAFEEPCDHAYFILVSSARNSIPATIRSRAQSFLFSPLKESELKEAIAKKGFSFSEQELAKLLKLAEGSFDFLSRNASESLPTQAELTTWLKEREKLQSEISRVFERDKSQALSLAAKLSREKSPEFWSDITLVIRASLHEKNSRPPAFWGRALEKTVETRHAIERRNLNPALQLSELFLFFAE